MGLKTASISVSTAYATFKSGKKLYDTAKSLGALDYITEGTTTLIDSGMSLIQCSDDLIESGQEALEITKEFTSDIYQKGKNIGSDVLEKGKNVGSDVLEKGKNVGSDLYENGKNVGSNIYENGKNVGSNIYENGKNVGSDVYERGKDIG